MSRNITTYRLPVSSTARESSGRMMKSLQSGSVREQNLTNTAKSFSEKEASYLQSHERSVRSLNYRYLLDCRGEEL